MLKIRISDLKSEGWDFLKSHKVKKNTLYVYERSIPDYELSEFKTVIEADTIKGTKHTKDECTLLSMYNAGHIGVIPTIF